MFEPFFTTKPTGEGPGWACRSAYDIVAQGHGGTLEAESVEGEGTTFVISLPVVETSSRRGDLEDESSA